MVAEIGSIYHEPPSLPLLSVHSSEPRIVADQRSDTIAVFMPHRYGENQICIQTPKKEYPEIYSPIDIIFPSQGTLPKNPKYSLGFIRYDSSTGRLHRVVFGRIFSPVNQDLSPVVSFEKKLQSIPSKTSTFLAEVDEIEGMIPKISHLIEPFGTFVRAHLESQGMSKTIQAPLSLPEKAQEIIAAIATSDITDIHAPDIHELGHELSATIQLSFFPASEPLIFADTFANKDVVHGMAYTDGKALVASRYLQKK